MPKTKKKKVELVKNMFNRANNSHRQVWRRNRQQDFDFSLNDQLTSKERTDLENAGMPDFIIDMIRPVIEVMKHFVVANNPRWQGVGAEGSDVDVAAVHSDLASYCWSLSGGNALFASVIQDTLTKSVGYFHIDVDPNMDRGMGEVIFKSPDPWDVYVDIMSRDFLFRDAAYIIIKKDIPRRHLINLLPKYKSKIKRASSDLTSTSPNSASMRRIPDSDSIQFEDLGSLAIDPETSEEDDILDTYETYVKEKVPYLNIFTVAPPSPQEMKSIDARVRAFMKDFVDEISVGVKEKIQNIQDQLAREEIIPERAELEIRKVNREAEATIAEKEREIFDSLKNKFSKIENQVVTEEEYNEVLAKNKEFMSTVVDLVPYYETKIKVSMVVGDQFLYEHYLPCSNYPIVPIPFIHTGTPLPMSAVTPLVGKQQEINKAHQILIHNANLSSNVRWLVQEGSIDEEVWETATTVPGARLIYRAGFEKPDVVLPLTLNQAFFQLVQEGKTHMEYLSGIPSQAQGFSSEKQETYRGLLALDEYSTRRIRSWMKSVVEPALEHLGRVFLEFAQATYTAHKVFRIVQPGEGDDLREKKLELNVPIYDDYGKVVGKLFDYSSAKFDVKYVAGSTMPVNRWALIDEYFRWWQSGLLDDIAMIAESDIRNKEALLKRHSIYSQLKKQIATLEAMVKDREGTIETLQRQVVQAGIRDQINIAGAEIKKDVLETEAQQKFLQRLFKEQQKKQKQAEPVREKGK